MNYKLAFDEIKVGNLLIKNRIVASAISINKANEDGSISENIIDYYTNLAKNNIGLVVVGGASVSNEGKVTKNEIHIKKTKAHTDGLKELSKSIKQFGTRAAIQICHVGAQGNPKLSGYRTVGPSKYISPDIGIECHELSIGEIKKIEDQYADAIQIVSDAGFDFFEIHIAHGYLLHEFISPYTNRRNDEYGGDEINRFRIIKNILEKIKMKVDMKKIGFRISGDDYIPNGLNIKKQENLIKMLDDYNISYYTVTAGLYETAKYKYINMENGNYWNYSQQLKKITKKIVITQGGISSIKQGEKLLLEKKGDLFGMAQALIADPEIITKTINNNENSVFECLAHIKVGSCHKCRYLKQKDLNFSCVTPSAWCPPKNKKYQKPKDIRFWKNMLNRIKNN
jgi:2,4-dienoyl-CoA reductase-like NADH-dependent reductase (Old Yellow Enzyme family)